tara:strand:- start:738 stop:1007 length:270 start_codon:yes stop_codon:yes gene_type:complete
MSKKEEQYASDDQAYQTDMHYARKETKMSNKIEKRNVFDHIPEWKESSIDNLVRYYFDDNKTVNEAIKILDDEGILENRFGSQWRIKAG